MWKISVVMLVTTAFAALLICEPYEVSLESAALPINPTVRPVSGDQAATAPVAAPLSQTIRPEDIGPKTLAYRDKVQEPVGKAAAALAWPPSPTSIELVDRPVLQPTVQSVAQEPITQPAPARYEAPPRADEVATVAPKPLPASNTPQERPVVQTVDRTPQPTPGKREDAAVSRVDVAIVVDRACSSGEVVGLDPNGDNFLSVQSGPGGQPYREIDRLLSADTVHVCGRKAPWLAVIYSAPGKAHGSCDIASKGTGHPYEGPCRYGWVHSHYVKVKAADKLALR
jgi:hypothetical protein